jgi:myo-inositol 2-dehydrogenase/D-chiro-inositol 1-dehydrogenase
LEFFEHHDERRLRGWKSIHITDGVHPYMKNWWVPGLQIGYEHTFIHQVADFLQAAGESRQVAPSFRDGLAVDYVTDAVLNSAKTKQWQTVDPA